MYTIVNADGQRAKNIGNFESYATASATARRMNLDLGYVHFFAAYATQDAREANPLKV